MSETKEATYKSLLQRMVHMTEQRDFDEDLMKEVYGALLPPRKFEAANEKVSRLTAERDDLSRKLAVAEGELKRAERIASMDSNLLVDERIRCIAELESQLAEAINSQVDATEQLEREREDYETLVKEAVELRKQIATPHACAAHAPVARYPEVVEFLDAVGDGPWSMSAGVCEGKASYYVQSVNVDNGTWFTRDTLAAACRAALDSRKELSDVD